MEKNDEKWFGLTALRVKLQGVLILFNFAHYKASVCFSIRYLQIFN